MSKNQSWRAQPRRPYGNGTYVEPRRESFEVAESAKRRRLLVGIVAALFAGATSASIPNPVAAAGIMYTLPYYSPEANNQDYGCTTYTNEPAFTTGTNADGIAYNCPALTPHQYNFHKGNDYDLEVGDPVVAAAAGTVVARYNSSSGSTCGTISEGNYLVIQHDSTHFTKYYHLAQNTLLFTNGQQVSVGQKIAESGNTGNSCGPHLHYQLQNCLCSTLTTYPSKTYKLDGKWTIGTTGRLPWLASFNSQLSGTTPPGAADVCKGQTTTFWVKFRNDGGLTWSNSGDSLGNGRITLRSADSSGYNFVASNFQAADWESSTLVTQTDQATVAPDALGTFTFGLYGYGAAVEGTTYTAYFNIASGNLYKFSYSSLGNYSVRIFIVPHQTGEC